MITRADRLREIINGLMGMAQERGWYAGRRQDLRLGAILQEYVDYLEELDMKLKALLEGAQGLQEGAGPAPCGKADKKKGGKDGV